MRARSVTARLPVNYHRDYWDAAEELYMNLPLLGGLLRYLRSAFACRPARV